MLELSGAISRLTVPFRATGAIPSGRWCRAEPILAYRPVVTQDRAIMLENQAWTTTFLMARPSDSARLDSRGVCSDASGRVRAGTASPNRPWSEPMSDLPEGVERLDDTIAAQRRLQELLQGSIPIRYADNGGARVKRGSRPVARVLLDLKGHIDVTMALSVLKSITGNASYDYDLTLSGAITTRRSYLVLTAECRQPARCTVKLVFNPLGDHELLRRAWSSRLLIGAWPRVADQRPLELLLAHPDNAGCSCSRCVVMNWALKS
jgi:hypothetical protein